MAAVLLAAVAGCGPTADDGRAGTVAPATSAASRSPAPAPTAPRTFVAVGDSITAGATDPSQPLVEDRVQGDASWLPAAEQASGVDLVGGWAVPGATTADMLAGVEPTDWTADAVVVMAGTNDLVRGVPWQESAAAIQGVVAATGAPTALVVAIAPNDLRPAARNGFNAALAELAGRNGWTYLDPWTEVDAGGAFPPGASPDGVHPAPAVAADAGDRIGRSLAALG
ncbi:Lysophospholipase L1 [Geodermatophilus obscurus]|uniref:Lysophospholipase L1 n=1 Tax=Geodermatophilus obscurus TaxID=1861 RepID=A0A1M7UPY0_9ACTN|nr:Lysophospholipase L1 [Geodermatophilus obscurus]